MKKFTPILLTILTLTLAACGAASNGTEPASANQSGAAAGELPVTTQLILGTLKLEETENAVTAEQAAELLPLWQTMQVLSESDTAADQETEALMTQIQETMTDEQRQAITAMNLTREAMFTIMQDQGLALDGDPAGRQSNNSQGANPNGGGGFRLGADEFPGGAPPQGGFPGGGGGGSGLTPDQIATAQAARQAGGGNVVPPMLINTLIEYLQEKAGS